MNWFSRGPLRDREEWLKKWTLVRSRAATLAARLRNREELLAKWALVRSRVIALAVDLWNRAGLPAKWALVRSRATALAADLRNREAWLEKWALVRSRVIALAVDLWNRAGLPAKWALVRSRATALAADLWNRAGLPGKWASVRSRATALAGHLPTSWEITNSYLYWAAAFYILASLILLPVAGEAADNAVLYGTPLAWLTWHTPLFFNWKFGADLTLISLASVGLHSILVSFHINSVAAVQIAWKLPFALAGLAAAPLLLRIGRQLGAAPNSARLVALLWLLSPAVLLVGAGYGEEETLAAVCLLAGITLFLDNRPFGAGLVFGLGAGIEYWPIAGVAFGLWVAIGRRERLTLLWRLAWGSALGLLLSFGPVVLSKGGIAALAGGLSYSANAANHSVGPEFPFSVWAFSFLLFGRENWLLFFVGAALVTVVVLAILAARSPTQSSRLATIGVSALLLEAVLINAHALAQYSVTVGLGLLLLMLVRPVNPLTALGPILAVWTFLTYVSINASYSDIDPGSYASGPSLPVNQTAVGWMMMAAVLFVLLPLVRSRWRQTRFGTASAFTAVLCSLVGCAVIAGWSLQPRFWADVLSPTPVQLQQFGTEVAFEQESASVVDKALVVKAPLALVDSVQSASVKPATIATLAVPPAGLNNSYGILTDSGCGLVAAGATPAGLAYCLPGMPASWSGVTSIWERVFTKMPGADYATVRRDVTAQFAGQSQPIHGTVLSTGGGWYRVSFLIPVPAQGDPGPGLTIASYHDPSVGPRVSLLPARGTAAFTVAGRSDRVTFHMNSNGLGQTSGTPVLLHGVVRPADLGVPLAQVATVGVVWGGAGAVGGVTSFLLWAGGWTFAELLLLLGLLSCWWLVRELKQDGEQSTRARAEPVPGNREGLHLAPSGTTLIRVPAGRAEPLGRSRVHLKGNLSKGTAVCLPEGEQPKGEVEIAVRRGPRVSPLTLTDHERAVLEKWARPRTTSKTLTLRSRIVLAAASGENNRAVAEHLRVTQQTVGKWRRRFLELRLAGLSDQPLPTVPPPITDSPTSL